MEGVVGRDDEQVVLPYEEKDRNVGFAGCPFAAWLGMATPNEQGPHQALLYAVVLESQAKNVLEIGVAGGNVTRPLLCALALTDGHLWSIDINDCSKPWQIEDLPPEIKARWTFTQSDSDSFAREHKAALQIELPLDVLAIDGWHSVNQARRDFQNFGELVRPGGYIFIHDTSFIEGPKRVLEEASAHLFEKISFDLCHGAGLLRRR